MKKLILLLLLIPSLCISQSIVESHFIDSVVNAAMQKFPQAGIAIGVIEKGEVTHLKGYGVRSVETRKKVDENTLFAIASNSKAFTSVALGILADQGKLAWNDRVVTYIPEFKMYDAYVTENFTIIDLLTHRSGLGTGAGDLIFFPDGSEFTFADLIASFQYQTPTSDFRTQFDYDNLLYVVAGEVVKRVSGKTCDKFIEDEIMSKLGMRNSAGMLENITEKTNIASPHSSENQKVIQLKEYTQENGLHAAAGGIYSSVKDMTQWVSMLLNRGLYGENLSDTLISPSNHKELWKLHTNISYNAFGEGPYNTHYEGYGLGFFLRDEKGHTIVQHSGGLTGMLSMVTLIPELNAGIIVLTNSSPGGLGLLTLTNEIKDEILGVSKGMDWLEWAEVRLSSSSSEADSVVSKIWEKVEQSKKTKPLLTNFTGTYRDSWFGEVEIYEEGQQLKMQAKKSPKLNGLLHFYNANTFVVEWKYSEDLGADNYDAFAIFQLDENGHATSFKMKGISPAIDFSYDFQDLDLQKISK